MKKVFCCNEMDKMPDWTFRIMAFLFDIADIFSSPKNKLGPFNVQKGQTVIDYGSGTGRYIPPASQLVGDQGLVYAVDIHELAIEAAFRQIKKHNLQNVKPIHTDGKTVNIPDRSADVVYALDMFHMVKDTDGFLAELRRLTKPDGILYLENGHQSRSSAKDKVLKSGCWEITEETKRFIRCRPRTI